MKSNETVRGQKNSTASPEKTDKKRQKTDPVHPPVSDPPVPNRAHTEMRTEFPPEIKNEPKREF